MNQKEYLDFQLSVTKRGLRFINHSGVVPRPLYPRIILFLKCQLEIAGSLCNPFRILFSPSTGHGQLIGKLQLRSLLSPMGYNTHTKPLIPHLT